MDNEQKADTDRLIVRCASLIKENETLTQRRKEALRSYLEERTKVSLIKESLLLAVELIGDRLGTCPGDTFNWQHPDTCDLHCGKDGGAEKQIQICWLAYLEWLGLEAYELKMDGGTFSILSVSGENTPDNQLELPIVDDPGNE